MARWHPKSCKVCGRSHYEGFSISARGLCHEHSLSREVENILAMQQKEGHFYDHWVRRSYMAAQRARVALEREAV